jgi:hypothetical protein
VTVRCNFASATSDSSSIKPAVYFIDEYDKSYRLIMKGGQGEAKFQIDKPTVARLDSRNQGIHFLSSPETSWNAPLVMIHCTIQFHSKERIRAQ